MDSKQTEKLHVLQVILSRHRKLFVFTMLYTSFPDDYSLADPDEVLENFMRKQRHNR